MPDRIRGRIFAVDGMLVTLTFGLSAILTGWLADVFTAETTALAMGGVALVWAIVWTLPDRRRPPRDDARGLRPRTRAPPGAGRGPEPLAATRRASPVVAGACPRAPGSGAGGGAAGGTSGPPNVTPGPSPPNATCGAPASRSASSTSKNSSSSKLNVDAMITDGNCFTRWL